jgi:DNA-binding LacI/PurR family transcriptional regulator
MDEARLRVRVVPRDLSVIGYNDIPDAARATPPLTTIDGMNTEKGRIADRLVLQAEPVRREVLRGAAMIFAWPERVVEYEACRESRN